MIFNSFEFLALFVVIFFLYWIVSIKNRKLQNIILLLGGYVFYGWSDWRLLSYLVGASIINYSLGIYIEKTDNPKRKQWLVYLGLLQGIGGLSFFKYYNFFVVSIKSAFHQIGVELNIHTLNLLVPIGISFFTFKTISYLLDINKGKMNACKDWVAFFTYVSFFPTILSGPIDRAKNFIPQLEKNREFEYDKAMSGVRQIFWGLFKKVVIANTLSEMASFIFSSYTQYNSITLIFGTIVYSFQMYADFCGYSDMAIGISRVLGFDVTPNFNYPFMAENIADFWRRWHMSLTSWLTEYVFTPLSIAFRDYGKFGLIISITINFIICGIWHGANWTFVLWGLLHGIYFIPLILKGTFNKTKKVVKGKLFPSLKQLFNIIITFMIVSLTLVIFRAETIGEAFGYYKHLLTANNIHPFSIEVEHKKKEAFIAIFLILIVDFWFSRDIKPIKIPRNVKFVLYILVSILILVSLGKEESFIYFKF